ncbi:glycosyltransferase family 4 protein [Pedobacter xixiisoli]|uniref:Glycosyltransferase involved in cell wall bisynthesis n=1 Tax=Pedobacter xixiisoli TaxID=1476464 RepID=A0A286A9L9_9SPHI|nr:glycosyltransferase family 4 protein [Pedobacter xixiisoli]SOD18610.1 Glycosyltransferase involved in cell wall bisynthesis [Pedobacter xixiisoli]
MKKLAIIISHPIQYYVPIFRLLAKQCELKVFYTWGRSGIAVKYDPDFGKTFEWDVPLLDGYNYELLENTAKDPGSHHGKGIINPNILTRIEDFSPNVILVYGYIYQSHFKVMRYFKGKIPIWFRGDSTLLDHQSAFKSILKKIYLKWVYSFVDKAFYVGTNNKTYFKAYGLKESQLFFAPHAIDNERFAENRKEEAEALRSRLGINKKDLLILFAGKLEQKKNPTLLLDAFIKLNQLKTKNDQRSTTNDQATIHLLFVGNGILETELKQKASNEQQLTREKKGKTKNIHFMDFQNQSQMPVIYQACNIFCLPSQGPAETWGLAINEAMAAGKAIIASNKVGCAIDLVKEDLNGKIFNTGDLTNLLQTLTDILSEDINILEIESRKIISAWNFDKQVKTIINEF